jgi:hypothetical protein
MLKIKKDDLTKSLQILLIGVMIKADVEVETHAEFSVKIV